MLEQEKNIKRLNKFIACEDVVLFIGSGFSLKAGAPSVSVLKDMFLKEGGDDFAGEINIKKDSLATLTEKFVNYNGGSRYNLISVLQQAFSFEHRDLSDHELLCKIPHFRTIFTTNYDTLIEETYDSDEISVANTNASCTYTNNKRVSLYKIHGDLSSLHSPESIVITESDYKDYFKGKRNDLLWTRFKNESVSHHVLFIGYSLEDFNILRIIKELHKLAGNSIKEMFLVAPNMSEEKRGRIKRYVTYINATAEEFLPQVIESLKDSIYFDYKNKKVCDETYSLFCERNGNFVPVCKRGKDHNRTERIDSINGNPLNHKIQMEIPKKFDINNPATYVSHMVLKGTNIRIPALKINHDDLVSYSHQINGIKVADTNSYNSIFIGPTTDELECTLKLPSIKFKEVVKGCRYVLGKQPHIKLESPLFIIHIIGGNNEECPNYMEMNFEFLKSTKNLAAATKWIKFLIEVFSQGTIYINNLQITNLSVKNGNLEELYRMSLYYEALASLEFTHNVNFGIYETYSELRFAHALMLISYKEHKRIDYDIPLNGNFAFRVDGNKIHEEIHAFMSHEMQLAKWEAIGNFNLCGVNFNIPFVCTIFNRVKLKLSKDLGNKQYEVESPNFSCCNAIFASDKSQIEEDSESEGVAIYLHNK